MTESVEKQILNVSKSSTTLSAEYKLCMHHRYFVLLYSRVTTILRRFGFYIKLFRALFIASVN